VAGILTWLLFCGCQRNAVPNSEHSGFGFMPNPGVDSTYLCGLELAELGTHENAPLISLEGEEMLFYATFDRVIFQNQSMMFVNSTS
jgi:hypothetical protein